MGFELTPGTLGLRAVATGRWTDADTARLRGSGAVELELNNALGWEGSDVGFLAQLSFLRGLTLIHLTLESVEAIHALHNLELLKVNTYCRTPIRADAFPRLRRLSLEWRPRSESIFNAAGLEELFINRYKGKDLTALAPLQNLTSLGILGAPLVSLEGIAGLTKLRSLRLGAVRSLKSLVGLEALSQLEELDLNTSKKIGSVAPLTTLTGLKKLALNNVGPIDSFAPLANLAQLEMLAFYEDTNVLDGDLSFILGLKRLSSLTFMDRRHCSHRRDDLQARLR